MKQNNVDSAEIKKFSNLAKEWWDPRGKMKPLHLLNPLRLQFVQEHAELAQKKVLDVGCGGGILSEALAKAGAQVSGVDMSAEVLDTAKQHAEQQSLNIDYQLTTVEAFAEQHPGEFNVVTCMELLEHVPDPQATIKACADLLTPGGRLFVSTLNRNAKSFLTAIVGAEYILNMLPKGTHEYAKFIRPSELTRWAEAAGLQLVTLQGIRYRVLADQFELCDSVDVNYLACFSLPPALRGA